MEKRKLAEAEAALSDAAKCERSGWLKSRDLDGAASAYERAATLFRVARAYPQAIEAYMKAADAQQALESAAAAARLLESAAVLAKDNLKAEANAAALYERASELHLGVLSLDRAAAALCKAARTIEGSDTPRACALMLRACSLFDDGEEEAQLRHSADTFGAAVALLLRAGCRSETAALLRRQVLVYARLRRTHDVARSELSAVIINLAAGEYEQASIGCTKAEARPDGFAGTDEADLARRLLAAFAAQDADGLAAAVSDGTLAAVDNTVALLARDLTLASARVPAAYLAPPARRPAAAGSGAASGGGCLASSAAAHASEQPVGTGDFGEMAPEDELEDDDLT